MPFLVASPARFNPPGVKDALAELVALIGGARRRVTVQLLSYSLERGGGREKFTVIDQALRRAARRGVRVQVLVSNWNLRAPQVEGLRELARVPNIDVKFAVIPPFPGGFIPYARVIHSKVMRVDDDLSWVGTSNWGHDYFSGRAMSRLSCDFRKWPVSWTRYSSPCGTVPMSTSWTRTRNTSLPRSIN